MGSLGSAVADKIPLTARMKPATDAVRPFRAAGVPEEALTDLKTRIRQTRWPERETVVDDTQGVQLATMQRLARYWVESYDWRKLEARLNALPQFITEIDGLDIHFIHVRSRHENALPMIVTHGWPGSVVEQMKIIDPLTNPTAHGGSAADAFHLVVPSMPGYGYSGKPDTAGWDVPHIARAWTELMKRLGYKKFVAQGGDWGAIVTEQMGVEAPSGLLGIHVNMPGIFPGRDRSGGCVRSAGAIGSVAGGEAGLRTPAIRLSEGDRLWLSDGPSPADAVWDRRFSHRPGGLFPRSRQAQLRDDRPRLCR
jgi:pimeloyl-ACP methyl ester carboxylesterase